MTATTQTLPVESKKAQGPNTVLLVVFGVLAAIVAGLFVVKPLFFDGEEAPAVGEIGRSEVLSEEGAPSFPQGIVPGEELPGTVNGEEVSDAAPRVPAKYAERKPRDPFRPLED